MTSSFVLQTEINVSMRSRDGNIQWYERKQDELEKTIIVLSIALIVKRNIEKDESFKTSPGWLFDSTCTCI